MEKRKNDELDQALGLAAQKGDIPKAKELIAQGANINSLIDGVSPLFSAAYNDDVDMAQLLIDHGAEVNLKNRFDDTALHMAALIGYKKMTAFLLRHGANVTLKNKQGATPLHEAVDSEANYKHSQEVVFDVVTLLLAYPIAISAKDNEGRTALTIAQNAEYKDKDAVIRLLKDYESKAKQ